MWDFEPGLHRREVATYLLSEHLGLGVIPPTVLRDGPLGEGSVQWFVVADHSQHYFTIHETHPELHDRLRAMALLDVLANNTDRKSGHVLLIPERNGEPASVWGIDNGLCFAAENKLRTVIWEFGDEEIPDAVARTGRRPVRACAAGGRRVARRRRGRGAPATSGAGASRIDGSRPIRRVAAIHGRWSERVRRPGRVGRPTRRADSSRRSRRPRAHDRRPMQLPRLGGPAPGSQPIASMPSRPGANSGLQRRSPSTAWPCSPPRTTSRPCSTSPTGLSGRFTIGPLTEVAAQHHTWDELRSVLDLGPRASFVAHERVLRGERIEASDLPAVLDLPLVLAAVGARLPLATYTDAGAEFPMPDLSDDWSRRHARPRGDARRRGRPRRAATRRAVADGLERPRRRRVRRGWRRRGTRSARAPTRSTGRTRRRDRAGLARMGGCERWRSRSPPRRSVRSVRGVVDARGARRSDRRLAGAAGGTRRSSLPSCAGTAGTPTSPTMGWTLQLAVEDRDEDVAWAILARDAT